MTQKLKIRNLGFTQFPIQDLFGNKIIKVETKEVNGFSMFRATTLLEHSVENHTRILDNFLSSKHTMKIAVLETSMLPSFIYDGEIDSDFFKKKNEEVMPKVSSKEYKEHGVFVIWSPSRKGGTYMSKHMIDALVDYALPEQSIVIKLTKSWEAINEQINARIACIHHKKTLSDVIRQHLHTDIKERAEQLWNIMIYDKLNKLVFGQGNSDWKRQYPSLSIEDMNQRDHASVSERLLLEELEEHLSWFIEKNSLAVGFKAISDEAKKHFDYIKEKEILSRKRIRA